MARIRTIKPAYWTDEKLAPLDPITRLVFLGLVSQADDAGRIIDSVRMIDGLLFPYSDDSSRESLEILARLSRVVRYTSSSGQKIIQIRNWEEHQRVDNPSAHVLPAPTPEDLERQEFSDSSREASESLARSSPLEVGSRKKEVGSRNTTDTSKSDEPISDLWEIWIEELGGKAPHPKLTKKRRQKLRDLYIEQLRSHDDPLAFFRRILKAVKRSEHHMSTRGYQMPESLFRNEDRRDKWVQETVNPVRPKPGTEAHKVAQRGEPRTPVIRPYVEPEDHGIEKVDVGRLLKQAGIERPRGAA